MLQTKNITWIIVADGSKARIFASDKSKHNLKLINNFESAISRLHSKDLGSDKPRRIFERETPESRVNLHKKEEEDFAILLSDLLNKAAYNSEFQRLILVSPSKVLGNIRAHLKKQTLELITKEINKDLTNINELDLPSYIWT